ncbi:helix-turn-helix domain-containing protein [Aquimarina pacifica]|uniref:helix-turn-helix domain-containing protein n=1 Tax=Aquimarina pacifica TaxID=1296415 RepID=UPI00046FBA17|nr:helix-turn-helix domain-containing protein [Aquimarina pacifica]
MSLEKILEGNTKELEGLDAFRSEFFNNLFQEIRTPLSLVNRQISELEELADVSPSISVIQTRLRKQINSITEMVDRVMELDMIEASSFNPQLKSEISNFATVLLKQKTSLTNTNHSIKNKTAQNSYNKQDGVIAIKYHDDFIIRLKQYVYEKSQDTALNQDIIAEAFNLSKSSFYRKVKRRTGLSPNNFIKEIRLQKAREILEKKPEILLKQIALEVGFSHYAYFSKIYTKRFGSKPTNKNGTHKYSA